MVVASDMGHPLLGGLLGLRGSEFRRLSQDTPLDIGAEVFTAHNSVGGPFDDDATFGRNLALSCAPLAGCWHGNPSERGQFANASDQLTSSINCVHSADDKALPKKNKGIASKFLSGDS